MRTAAANLKVERRCAARARRAFVEQEGLAAANLRVYAISLLETKMWKGRRVYALLCDADFGKGPHTVFVPEHVLWSLLSFDHFRCPYHR